VGYGLHNKTRGLPRLFTTYDEFKYFILFNCCYSCYITLHFIKSHNEALQHFTDFRTVAENFCVVQKLPFFASITPLNLPRVNSPLTDKTQALPTKKTVPDTPNQNGVAERCNLTLASMTRALLIDADLSGFWPFAIQTAVHIKNRVPHSSLPPSQTPFEFWHGNKPNLAHLQPFGTSCTTRSTHILSNSLTKFGPRGKSSRFLGYSKDAKGYLIWVPGPLGQGGTAKVRRDVIFHDFPIPVMAPTSHHDFSPLWDDILFPERILVHNKQQTTESFTNTMCTLITNALFTVTNSS
jgi:hypothetical protein